MVHVTMGSMNDSVQNLAENQFELLTLLPWLLLGLFFLPLIVAARFFKTFPSTYWVVCFGTALVLSVLAVLLAPAWAGAVLVLDWLFLIFANLDFLAVYLSTNRGIEVHREISKTSSQGVPMDSTLMVENRSSIRLVGEVRDDVPDSFLSQPNEHQMDLPVGARATYQRRIKPTQRGAFQLERVSMRFASPLRLWVRFRDFPEPAPINVYPDMKQLSDYALLARTNRLSLIGVRRTRRIGQDSDFERLRDYSRDDNFKHIDWRSTARRNKLTVRQFQSDQSQRVIFMLDCGRMMTNKRDGYTLLDHALNSALMMAYVALHQGDSVGMVCFSDRVHAFIPPRGGRSQMNRLIHASFDQFPRMVESRYDQAFLHLRNRCKRRSLVVLATNVIDEVNALAVSDYLRNINGQHLPMGVLMRDRSIFEAADHPDGDPMNMYRAAVASDILLWRNQLLNDLHHHGVLLVDTFPDELTAPLVNQYLQVKAKHLL